MKKKDWTLLAISAAQGEPLTPVQLQKSLFLLGKKRANEVGDSYYTFVPYNYGPFCAAVYSDAEALESEGLVRIDREEPGRSWPVYLATPSGLHEAARIKEQAPKDAVDYLAAVVQWTRTLTFNQLVSAIYEAFPDQRANSVFRN